MNKRIQSTAAERASKDALFRIGGWAADKLLLILLLGAVCLFVLYPMVCIFLRSFQGEGGFSLAAYEAVWKNYRVNLRNSIFVGVLTAVFCTILSVAAALFLSTEESSFITGETICVSGGSQME